MSDYDYCPTCEQIAKETGCDPYPCQCGDGGYYLPENLPIGEKDMTCQVCGGYGFCADHEEGGPDCRTVGPNDHATQQIYPRTRRFAVADEVIIHATGKLAVVRSLCPEHSDYDYTIVGSDQLYTDQQFWPVLKIDLIVSRHRAAIEWIAHQFVGEAVFYKGDPSWVEYGGNHRRIQVLEQASAEDVRGKRVAGNLPLHLAAECKEVLAIEFAGDPPRGREYTVGDMLAADARLVSYVVNRR